MSAIRLPSFGAVVSAFGIAFTAVLVGLAVPLMPYWITGALIVPVFFGAILLWPPAVRFDSRPLRWALAFFLLAYSIWPQYSAFKVPGLPAVEPQRVVFGILIVWSFFLVVNNPAARQSLWDALLQSRVQALCIGLIYFLYFARTAFADDVVFREFLIIREILTVVAMYPVALLAIRCRNDVKFIFAVFALMAIVVSAMAIVESLKGQNLFASWVPLNSAYAVWATAERIRDGAYRAQAVFDNPLLLVDFLATVWPIALAVALTQSYSAICRAVGFFAAIAVPIALIKSGSRSSYIVLAIELALFVIVWAVVAYRHKKAGALPFFVAFAFIGAAVTLAISADGLSGIVMGRSTEEAMSTSARYVMLSRAWEDLAAGQLFGHGFGVAASVVGIKHGPPGNWIYVLDNHYVSVLLDGGILALAAYLTFVVASFRCAFIEALRSASDYLWLSLGAACSVAGFFVVKAISSQVQVFPILFIVLSCIAALSRGRGDAQ